MEDPTRTKPFAHTIEPYSLDSLAELVGHEEWEKSKTYMEKLSKIQHPAGGGATYYVLFLDPTFKTLRSVVTADWLYLTYNTKFYNDEILLITPK